MTTILTLTKRDAELAAEALEIMSKTIAAEAKTTSGQRLKDLRAKLSAIVDLKALVELERRSARGALGDA